VWEGKRIIPSSWVDRAQEGKVPATFGFHYANLWWSLPEKGAYMGGMPELAKAIGVDVMTGPARICDLAAGQQRGTAVAHHLTRVSGRAAAGGAASGTWKSAVVLFTIQSGPLKKQHSCELEK